MSEIDELKPSQEAQVHALVRGKELAKLPSDLYIPPDALRVFLELFEGPLDLLLYLIRKQDLDILEISISTITDQYLAYIDMMTVMRLQLAGDYLVMAATLAEMKTRLMLPKRKTEEEEEVDPRVDLMRRLLEYEQIKKAATRLDELPRFERDFLETSVHVETQSYELPPPDVSIDELLFTFSQLWQRARLNQSHDVVIETMTVHAQMNSVLDLLRVANEYLEFNELFDTTKGRRGLVYTFLALLELLRRNLVEAVQNNPTSAIYVRAVEAG